MTVHGRILAPHTNRYACIFYLSHELSLPHQKYFPTSTNETSVRTEGLSLIQKEENEDATVTKLFPKCCKVFVPSVILKKKQPKSFVWPQL